jgi:hypothetical protein
MQKGTRQLCGDYTGSPSPTNRGEAEKLSRLDTLFAESRRCDAVRDGMKSFGPRGWIADIASSCPTFCIQGCRQLLNNCQGVSEAAVSHLLLSQKAFIPIASWTLAILQKASITMLLKKQ